MRVVYGLLSAFLIWVAVSVIVATVDQVRTGRDLPKDPAQRAGYIQGLFVAPTLTLGVGVWCGYLAIRPKRKKAESSRSVDDTPSN